MKLKEEEKIKELAKIELIKLWTKPKKSRLHWNSFYLV